MAETIFKFVLVVDLSAHLVIRRPSLATTLEGLPLAAFHLQRGWNFRRALLQGVCMYKGCTHPRCCRRSPKGNMINRTQNKLKITGPTTRLSFLIQKHYSEACHNADLASLCLGAGIVFWKMKAQARLCGRFLLGSHPIPCREV